MCDKQPNELWREAKGDARRYRELMIEHGHLILVTPENRPAPHVFKAKTQACPCEVCHGRFDAPWHVREQDL